MTILRRHLYALAAGTVFTAAAMLLIWHTTDRTGPRPVPYVAVESPDCRPSPPTTACAYDEVPIICGYELKCWPMRGAR